MADALPDDGETELEDMSGSGGGRLGTPASSPMAPLTPRGDEADDGGAGPSSFAGATFAPEDALGAAGDEILVPLAGINDDGYFGDAGGQWLRLEPSAEITFEAAADAGGANKTVGEEVREFWRMYGVPIVAGAVAIVAIVVIVFAWGSWVEGGGGGRGRKARPISERL